MEEKGKVFILLLLLGIVMIPLLKAKKPLEGEVMTTKFERIA